ncbi:MAG: DUF4933 domain-containing protein [Prevotella sp.]|jgi:hypothetical protein|nr:DUF4933 domain-containing protein [Prevotella sp.]
MKPLYISVLLTLSILCCNQPKTKGLTTEPDNTDSIASGVKRLEAPLDTTIPQRGIKYKEKRNVNPSNPPIILDLSKRPEQKEFNPANYYSSVEYITLKPGLSKEGKTIDDQVMKVLGITDKYILASGNTNYPAIYCYDRQGNFLYQIKNRDKPTYRSDGIAKLSYRQSVNLRDITISGSSAIYMTMRENDARINWLNLDTRQVYASRRYSLDRPHTSHIINANEYVNHYYYIFNFEKAEFLYSFNTKGDTICHFKNYNEILSDEHKSGRNPESMGDIYYYNDMLTIRQGYNDTIFRVISGKELLPAYIINLGHDRVDIPTAVYRGSDNKLVPQHWMESDHFILFHYARYMDGRAKDYFRTYYDKKQKKMYSDKQEGIFVYIDQNSALADCIPVTRGNLKTGKNLLYATFTKKDMRWRFEDDEFNSLPAKQKEIAKNHYDNLKDDELLVMIIK